MKKGLILIISAGILWGTSCVFVDILAPYGFSSLQMTAMRFTVAFLGLFIYCAILKREALRVNPKDILIFAVCGIMLFATATCYYEAMQLTSVSVAVVLMYISPVPIMLLSVLFFKERFTLIKGIAVGVMLVGCVLVAGIIGDFKPNPLGIAMGLLSAAAYTVYNIFNKMAAKRGVNPYSTSLYTFMFSAIAAIALSQPQEMPSLIGKNPAAILPALIALGAVTCLLPFLFYTISLKYISVGVASSLSIIEPMTGVILGVFVYSDTLSFPNIVGIVLIVGAVFLLGFSENEAKKMCVQPI